MNIHQQAILNHQLFQAIEQYESMEDLTYIKELIVKGADVNMVFDEETPLTYAFRKGSQDLIDFLMDNQEINITISWNIYNKDAILLHPLFNAIYEGHANVVKKYIEDLPKWGIDKTKAYYSNNNILTYAMNYNQLEIAEYFIENNIGVKDHQITIKHHPENKNKFEKVLQNIALKNNLPENPIVVKKKL